MKIIKEKGLIELLLEGLELRVKKPDQGNDENITNDKEEDPLHWLRVEKQDIVRSVLLSLTASVSYTHLRAHET